MKKNLVYLLLLAHSVFSYNSNVSAQNLVPNPSFEDISQCPFGVNQFNLANQWFVSSGTPDLFNGCSNNFLGVPVNVRGHQDAVEGIGYAGIITYVINDSNYREIIGTTLIQSMIVGQKYYISLFVSLSDTNILSCVTNNFGVRFSNQLYTISNPIPIDNNSSIFSNQLISNQEIWTVIRGSFVADSSYLHLYLGNLFDDINTDTTNCELPNSYISYYYLDQICVSTDSLDCVLYTAIHTSNTTINNFGYITVNHDEINIHPRFLNTHYEYEIVNLYGQAVIMKNYNSSNDISISEISTGYPSDQPRIVKAIIVV